MVEAEAGGITSATVERALREDTVALTALVRALGLARFRWLPYMLRWEFQRRVESLAAGRPVTLEVALPDDGSAWRNPTGRAPKHGETHHEDLEQYVTWFYRREVKRPPDAWKAIEKDYIRAPDHVTAFRYARPVIPSRTASGAPLSCLTPSSSHLTERT
jgi:hypothetical protein